MRTFVEHYVLLGKRKFLGGWDRLKEREDSSFSEEKEAKRLLVPRGFGVSGAG
jgi:hypothetical protein